MFRRRRFRVCPFVKQRSRGGAYRVLATAVAYLVVATALYGTLRLTFGPRPVSIHVRWASAVDEAARQRLEQRYGLSRPEYRERRTWGYALLDPSRDNIRALISDPAVEDTHNIHRTAFRVGYFAPRGPYSTRHTWIPVGVEFLIAAFLIAGTIGIGLALLERVAPGRTRGPVLAARLAFLEPMTRPAWLWIAVALLGLFHLQSLWLLLAGTAILGAACANSKRRRRNTTVAALLFVGVMAVAFPIDPLVASMGDAKKHAQSRDDFEDYFSGRIRYQKHLSHVIVLASYLWLDETEQAPRRALMTLARVATVWFVISAIAIGFLERWSPVVLRYLGIVLLAPATLLYFGWQEFGYLALNVAAFPLLLHGLRDGGTRLEGGSTLVGFGAALHGFGLLSLAGAWIAAFATRARLRDRVGRALRIAAWGTAAYVGWIVLYEIVLKLPIDPDSAGIIPWRPWVVGEVRANRLAAPFWSSTTARDLLMTVWVVGLPLLAVAASLRRQYPDEFRIALYYALPSIVFEIFRWPVQGLGMGMDLIVAAFPALYALAWVCAHDPKRTRIAAALLVSAHVAFWFIVHDPQFVNQVID